MNDRAHVQHDASVDQMDEPTIAASYARFNHGDGLRVSKTAGGVTTSYVWDIASKVPLILQDGTNTYVYGRGLVSTTDASGAQTYRLTDGLGSTASLADGAGNVTGSYTYDVFGAVRTHSGASTEYSYTGEQNDANALEYLRARYYDPQVGRFLSLDPLGGRYVYARNNPVNATDPTGLCNNDIAFDVGACVEVFGPMEIFVIQVAMAGGLASSCPSICPTMSNVFHRLLALIGADSDFGSAPQASAGGEPAFPQPPNDPNRLRDYLALLEQRTFRSFLESLETRAGASGGADVRSVEQTQTILQEALERGWTIREDLDTSWRGGPHLDLLGPSGEKLHFPIPEGFIFP